MGFNLSFYHKQESDKIQSKNKNALIRNQFKETVNQLNAQSCLVSPEANSTTQDKDISVLKKQINKLQTSIHSLENKIAEKSKDIAELKEKDKNNKKIIYNLKNSLKESEEKLSDTKEKYNELLGENDSLKIKLNNVTDNNKHQREIKSLQSSISILRKDKRILAFQNKTLKNTISNLNKQISNVQSLNYSVSLDKEKSKVANLTKQVQSLVIKNRNLEARLKKDNIKTQTKPTKIAEVVEQVSEPLKETILKCGYIVAGDENAVYFNSTENEKYQIAEYDGQLIIGSPCEAKIINDAAYITKQYNEELVTPIKNLNEVKGYKVSSKNFSKKDIILNPDMLKGYKILIIGSRNKIQYLRILKEHGAEASWFNPFNESIQRLTDKCNNADVVLICTRHVNHKVMNGYIDVNNIKYQLIKKDNNNTILSRARFALINLGHLKESDAA